ncbi:luciferin sulfotransferase-like [Homarus americanus]|uniref:luciferin sulfotransferase-like n=1 Tax=Homarus americanus TaxID=6706 RepID=UPI001C4620F0|nr:luciferin sulfotransferase-like [Homarus americanus]
MAEEFPYKIVTLPDEENEQIKRDFKGYISGAVKVEPLGYFFQGIYQDYAHRYYTLPVRSTDVFVASYPKCGTTWTQEMVWLLVHNLDYEGAKCRLDKRFPFTEEDSVIDSRIFKLPGIMKLDVQPPEPGKSLDMVRTLPDPRCLKTHMPFSLLTPGILDTCKMIYVARDPRDVVVSYYHHHRMWAPHCYNGDFKKFFNYFLSDQGKV